MKKNHDENKFQRKFVDTKHFFFFFLHIQSSLFNLFNRILKKMSVHTLTFRNWYIVDICSFTFNQGGKFKILAYRRTVIASYLQELHIKKKHVLFLNKYF